MQSPFRRQLGLIETRGFSALLQCQYHLCYSVLVDRTMLVRVVNCHNDTTSYDESTTLLLLLDFSCYLPLDTESVRRLLYATTIHSPKLARHTETSVIYK